VSGGQRREFSGDIARRAFDTVAAIQRVRDLAELDATVKKSFEAIGFHTFVGYDSVTARGEPRVNVLFGQTDSPWARHYLANHFDQHDVMIRASRSATEPFFWSDVTERLSLTSEEQRVMNEAANFRLREGFIVPTRNLDGSITNVMLGGEHIDPRDPDLRAAAHLMAVYFGAVGRRLHRARADNMFPRPRLTQRQLDCLRWVREGKSANDIGCIIGISQRTVEYHLAVACARLGVRTRTQAVAEAAVHNLIDL